MTKSFLFTCDLEEFTLGKEFGLSLKEEFCKDTADRGFERLLSIIEKKSLAITWFATLSMADRYRDILRHLSDTGHEIALHFDPGSEKDDKPILDRLIMEKDMLEDITGRPVYGIRTHKLQKIAYPILKEAGFIYDNSLHPTYVPGRYNNIFRSGRIKQKCGIIVLPITVMPFLRTPCSWIWFRNFGINYMRLALNLNYSLKDYADIYVHNWDYSDLFAKELGKLPRLIKRNTGHRFCKMTSELIDRLVKKEIVFETVISFIRRKFPLSV